MDPKFYKIEVEETDGDYKTKSKFEIQAALTPGQFQSIIAKVVEIVNDPEK